jgi:hypothetical protein
MADSSHIEDIAKRLLRAFVEAGARAGDELRDLPGTVHLPGQMADASGWDDYAVQKGWIERRPGDQHPHLTSAGYALTQSKD